MPVVDATPRDARRLRRAWSTIPPRARVEIVRWPALGWRTGRRAHWRPGRHDRGRVPSASGGATCCTVATRRSAGHYVLAYADRANRAPTHTHLARPGPHRCSGTRNYHPDGGQLFFPLDRAPFSRAARTARRRREAARISSAFRFDGQQGPVHRTRTSGTRACSACAARSASSTSRARFTPASRSTSRASSAACSKRRYKRWNFPYLLKASTGSIPGDERSAHLALSRQRLPRSWPTTSPASARRNDDDAIAVAEQVARRS